MFLRNIELEIFFCLMFFVGCIREEGCHVKYEGYTQGSTYNIHIIDIEKRDLKEGIDSILDLADNKFSIYNKNRQFRYLMSLKMTV
jgi:thiamine biosynthesis lipoprotein ApbE